LTRGPAGIGDSCIRIQEGFDGSWHYAGTVAVAVAAASRSPCHRVGWCSRPVRGRDRIDSVVVALPVLRVHNQNCSWPASTAGSWPADQRPVADVLVDAAPVCVG